jgi:hypothetical protein
MSDKPKIIFNYLGENRERVFVNHGDYRAFEAPKGYYIFAVSFFSNKNVTIHLSKQVEGM